MTRAKRKAIEQWENREDYDALVTLKLKSNISSNPEANRLKEVHDPQRKDKPDVYNQGEL